MLAQSARFLSNFRQRVSLRPNLKKVLSNTWWLFADRVLRLLFGLTIGIWVARYLGPEQFGLLNYVLALVALFSSVVPLGLDTIVVRELVYNNDAAGRLLGTTLLMRVAASFIMTVVAIGSVIVMPGSNRQLVLLTIIASLMIMPRAADVFDLYFQSQMQSKLTVTAKNTGTVVANVIRIVLILASASLLAFCWTNAAEAILGGIGLALTYILAGNSFRNWGFDWPLARRLFKEGWPLILSGMAIMLYMRIDVIMLKMMAGDVATGIYSAAYRVSEICYFVPIAITTSVSPLIIALRKSNEELYTRRLRQLFTSLALLSIVFSLITSLTSKWVVTLLFGAHFSTAAPVLAIHIWASVFVFLGVALNPWDVSENAVAYSVPRTFAGAITNIAINLILIPRVGAVGAAIATLISYAVSGVIVNAFFAKTRPVFLMQMRALLLLDVPELYLAFSSRQLAGKQDEG